MEKSTSSSRNGGLLRALLRETCGQDLIEWALLAGIATTVTIMCLQSIGTKVATSYDSVITEVAGGAGGAGGSGGTGGTGGTGGGSGDPGGDPGGGRGGGRGN